MREALKLALEALEFFKELSLSIKEIERAEEAITAIKEALAQPEQFPFKQLEEELTKIAELQDHIRLLNKQLSAQPEQEPVAWISVKDSLPKAVRGLSYKESITDTVLVRHSDRPDYPITAHAVLGEGLGGGISILTEGASEYPEIAWYSASSDLNNPFGLKNDDYERYLPRVFGSKITHWMPITTPPQRKPWVSLSDEDIERIAKKARSKDHAITLAMRELKEKNT